jgi:hypothetical protein
VFPVRYELGFYIPQDVILHSTTVDLIQVIVYVSI